jgi:hypothetical protein
LKGVLYSASVRQPTPDQKKLGKRGNRRSRCLRISLFWPIAYLSRMRNPAFARCIPTRGTKVPDRPKWFHEIKHYGYRLIVQREGKTVRL